MSDLRIASDDKSRVDLWIDRASEWLSSILVKESRQALKSRQFLWTFFALLLVVACWTVGALTFLSSPDGDDFAPGPFMLFGFWLILGFPLAIIIPFATFRSLAHEFEDGTLQLLSITTMKPYQIILGKLGVAMLQIMIYVSVLAPCVAFTYLLRAVDVRQIWWGLSIAVSGSAGLSVVGLFLASVTKSRSLGIALSVILLFGLAIVYWIWGYTSYGLTYMFSSGPIGMGDEQASVLFWSYVGFISSTAFVLFAATCSRISFPADNRSSLIRIATFVQTLVYMCIVVAALSQIRETRAAGPMTCSIALYWLFMGSMMSAVPAIMSRRVKRSLPTTTLGRSTKSLFMPGPGRGYLFAVGNIWGWSLLLVIIFFLHYWIFPDAASFTGTARSWYSSDDVVRIVGSAFGNCVYSTSFLSLVFLVMTWSFRNRPNQGPFVGLALAVVLLLICSFAPIVVQMQLYYDYGNDDYSIMQASNWFWTVSEFSEQSSYADIASISIIAATTAMLILGYFAMRIAGRELLYLPEAIPNRVMEEELQRRKTAQPLTGDSEMKHPLDD